MRSMVLLIGSRWGGDKVPPDSASVSTPCRRGLTPLADTGQRTDAEHAQAVIAGHASLLGADRRTIMNLQKRDLVATGLVAAAGVIYLLWLLDSVPTVMSGIRVTGAVILALGFMASATAVVPTFGQLLHGNKAYLAVTSLIGLLALIAGAVMLVGSSHAALAVVMFAMITMWMIATIHHSLLAKTPVPPSLAQVGETARPRTTV